MAISIDSFCDENKIKLDFLKLDVEGAEYKVLKGANSQLGNILGIRCEVNFDEMFEQMPGFSKIHEFLSDNNFFLLNLDYDGRGCFCNEFVEANGKYGIIWDCDAVWLKRYTELFKPNNEDLKVRVLKYAAFCLNNNASDVALDVLLRAVRTHRLDFNNLNKTRLYKFIDIAIHKLFFNLKWQPGQSLEKHKKIYLEIFNKKMKEMHEYNQSLELNPD